MRRVLAGSSVIVAALIAGAALYSLWPLGLSDRTPVAQIIAVKGLLAVVLLVLGGVLAVVGAVFVRRRGRTRPPAHTAAAAPVAGTSPVVAAPSGSTAASSRSTAHAAASATGADVAAEPRPRTRRSAVVVLGLGIVIALTGLSHGVALLDRGLFSGEVAASGEPAAPDAFTVLTLNTLGGSTGPEDVVDLAVRTGAAVLALPETDEALAARIEELIEEATGTGFETWTDGTGAIGSTSMLVSEDLGPYEQVAVGSTGGFGRVHLQPAGDDPDQPVLVAVHPLPPGGDNMADWRTENVWVVGMCERAGRPTVIAGDLNMTVDHRPLRQAARGDTRCRDAGLDVGIGGVGTWPTAWPAWAGSVIDHVLVAGGLYGVVGEVVDVGGSDHRAVVVELRLAGSG